jgi:pimeloyl-ACP methyl ester carboxylesterase
VVAGAAQIHGHDAGRLGIVGNEAVTLTVKNWPRPLRLIVKVIGAILAALLAISIAIIFAAEWKLRTAQVPTSATLSPPNIALPSPDGSAIPVLILLHGAGLNGRMWDPVRRGLDTRYRVIALDLPGHGSRRNEVFTPATASAAIAAAARSVSPAPVILVGDSLGGYAAIAGAQALPPAQLRGLIIAGASSNRTHMQSLRYLRDVVQITIMFTFIDDAKFIGKALAIFGIKDTDARAIVAAGVSARAVPFAARSLLHIDFRDLLTRVDAPVLIVNGSLDVRAIEGEPSFLAAARQSSSYRFENCEHGISMRRSAEFAAVVNAFAARAFALDSTPAPPSPESVKQ